MPEEKRSALYDVYRTRWIQRVVGLERTQEMMVLLLEALNAIPNTEDWSYARDARGEAQGLYWTFRSFQFAVH